MIISLNLSTWNWAISGSVLFITVHQELFLAVSLVTVQWELSGSVICYCAIFTVSGNVCFTVQYELFLASYV